MNMFIFGLSLCMAAIGFTLYANQTQNPPQRVIILLGPPGSGKGTQAVRLSKDLGIPHISTGDLFRENLSKNTELGKKAKSYMEAGKLVPDEIVLEMLFDRVSRPDASKGYLLDGFPRTIPQAEALDKHLDQSTQVVALNLEVGDDTIMKRIAGRLTCSKGGHVFNKYLTPPATEGKCDICGGELVQRPDDAPAVVEERLRVYHAQTEPLIAYYQKQGKLANINGENPPEKVFEELKAQVK